MTKNEKFSEFFPIEVTIYNKYCYICNKRTPNLKNLNPYEVHKIMTDLERKHPGQNENLQTVREGPMNVGGA